MLKLIRGLNHSKDGCVSDDQCPRLQKEELEEKKLYHLSFYIYKLRNIQCEGQKGGKVEQEKNIIYSRFSGNMNKC